MYLFNSYEELIARLNKTKTVSEAIRIAQALETRECPCSWINAAYDRVNELAEK